MTAFPVFKRVAKGFSLIEILVVMAIATVSLGVGLPGMSQFFARIQLKSSAQELSRYIDTARKVASRTECPTQLNVNAVDDTIRLTVVVEQNPELGGCPNWFKALSRPNDATALVREGELPGVTLESGNVLHFDAITGSLSANTSGVLRLGKGGETIELNFSGVGDVVLNYN